MEENVGNMKVGSHNSSVVVPAWAVGCFLSFSWLSRLSAPTTCPAWPAVLREGAGIHGRAATSWWHEVILLARGLKRSHENGAHSNHLLLRSVWAGARAGDLIIGCSAEQCLCCLCNVNIKSLIWINHRRLPHSSLISSWSFGSVCLEASLLFVFSRYGEEKIDIWKKMSTAANHTLVIMSSIFHFPSEWRSICHTYVFIWLMLYWQCWTISTYLSCVCVCVLVASYTPTKKVSGAPSPVSSSTVPGSNLSQSPTANTNRPESWKIVP